MSRADGAAHQWNGHLTETGTLQASVFRLFIAPVQIGAAFPSAYHQSQRVPQSVPFILEAHVRSRSRLLRLERAGGTGSIK
jgi:hypothetical protein